MTEKTRKLIIVGLVAVMLGSILLGVTWAKPSAGYKKTIEALDEKKVTVMKLTAASTAASVAVGAVPGDSTTPIAEKLADVSSYFLIVLCAILFEKYLLSITGFVALCLLIPAACILGILFLLMKKEIFLKVAAKVGLFGLLIAFIVPASVKVGAIIEDTYRTSIEQTIDTAENAAESTQEESAEDNSEETKGILDSIKDTVTEAATQTFDKFENMLSNFMEAVAVMLVTSCVIPIAVILFFVWVIKILLGFQIDVSGVSKRMMPKHTHKNVKKTDIS